MKAVVYHGPGEISLDDVPDPKIEEATDAIIRVTASAICGTDLHFVRDTFGGMRPGTVLGHEAVGIVEEVGSGARNLSVGDRVVIPSTIACGTCAYCRAGYYAQCDNANPGGKQAGTAFFGGPSAAGGFNGLQAEYARIPHANVGPVPLPERVSDEQAILISDIFPTAWFGAKLAEIRPGDIVAVLGAGPVGLFCVLSAFRQGAGRVIVVDGVESRLRHARRLHAETVDFNQEDPVAAVLRLTDGIGADRCIDAVGVDAQAPRRGPAAEQTEELAETFDREREQIVAAPRPSGQTWWPGDAPSQAVRWAVPMTAKAGTLSIVGVYPPPMTSFPLGMAMNRNVTVNMGNCNHRKYIPHLVDLVASGVVDPTAIITQQQPMTDAVSSYETFDRREEGWTKVILSPAA